MEPMLKGAAPPAAPPADLIKASDQTKFAKDVLEASRTVPVIVDFWAPWCGPCKTLQPAIEKVVKEAKGAVKLVKINIDQNQMLAQQLRIQSIPAVYAFFGGRPVDGFMGAVPESQIKQFVDRLVQAAGGAPVEGGADDLAAAYWAGDQRKEAIDELLAMIKLDRNWNEAAARQQLLKFFEALGFTDPLAVDGRKRLSTILFS